MSFTNRVISYIKDNYDIPEKMEFYIGTEGYDFEDWVDAYIEEYNNNVSSPYGDDSDESDVKVVGEEILQIMTAPYKMGNEYVINNDDFEASTTKTKKSQPTTKSFNDMVKSQRTKNICKGLGPEITADVNQLDDIAYLADACRFELGSIPDGIQEKAPSEIGFKCSVEEYKQKLLECKQLADWLVNNLEFWTFM